MQLIDYVIVISTIPSTDGFGLSGTFPEGIYNWPFVQTLKIVLSSMHGPLPSQLFEKMRKLVTVELSYSKFTGSIPESWWTEPMVQYLNVANNTLTGSISSNIGNMLDLRHFSVSKNMITGK